jgi:hypothetical protein
MGTSDDTSDGERLQDLHNQGQEDASNDVYNPPHGTVGTYVAGIFGEASFDKCEAEDEAYKAGHAHHENQT